LPRSPRPPTTRTTRVGLVYWTYINRTRAWLGPWRTTGRVRAGREIATASPGCVVNVTRAEPWIGESGLVATWTAKTRLPAPPDAVLAVLTDPDEIGRWAPVGFELVDYEGRRLVAGDRVRVRGALAGPSVSFDVDVAEADDGRLALIATGPITLDVDYRVFE